MAVDEPAYVVLEPYFEASKESFLVFCEERGLGSAVKKTRFEVSSVVRDSDRHFAATTTDGKQIVAAPELADCTEDIVIGIMAHEFGHVVDHLYPARFFLEDDESSLIFFGDDKYDPEDPRTAQQRVARMRRWENRSDYEVERTADLIVEQAIGHPIGYVGPCMLQSLSRGAPRPKKLR